MTLLARDLAMFTKLRIPPELVELAGICRVTDNEARELLGPCATGDMSGVCFPYFSPASMSNGGRRCYLRIRRDNPEIENGKPNRKYVSPYADRKHLYFPPRPELFADVAVPIVLVEAEKSALALVAWSERVGQKLLPLATGGCWGWYGQIGIKETPRGERVPEKGPIPDLNICGGGRITYVLLDANVTTNDSVAAARAKLVRQLQKQKAEVRILDLPIIGGVNGPDDFIATAGDEAMLRVFESPRTPEDFSRLHTEHTLAERFSEAHPELRYVAAWGKWMRYGPPWREDRVLKVFDDTRQICKEASQCETDWKTIHRLQRASTRAAVENMARSDPRHAATVEQWDRDPWALGTPTDTWDLKAGTSRKQEPEDYITKSAAVTPGGECAQWLSFLDKITGGNQDLQEYLQRVAGYCLTGVTSEEVFFFLYGTGSNGKTTFVETLQRVMGEYAQSTAMETLTESKNDRHPTEIADLLGARLVVASETEEGRYWSENRIKQLTGGDRVKARFMRQDFFEFTPQFKLMIYGNHKPGLRNVDYAIRRRIHLIPFTVTIAPEERILDFKDKLRAEWPGILRWALDGCREWQRQGLNPPQIVLDATENYIANEDAICRWRDERCILSKQAGAVRASVLYGDYRKWAEKAGEDLMTQKRFSQALIDRGHNIRRSNGSWVEGISLKPAED